VLAERYRTSVDGVFAAGDARVGASLVVTAIDEGRRCAQAVHAYLMADVLADPVRGVSRSGRRGSSSGRRHGNPGTLER
jgi:succinate dehydrogenase/fumarate reductase flavoprotein subunit